MFDFKVYTVTPNHTKAICGDFVVSFHIEDNKPCIIADTGRQASVQAWNGSKVCDVLHTWHNPKA